MWLGGIHTPEAVFHGCGFVGVLVQVLEAAPPGESGMVEELGHQEQTEPGFSAAISTRAVHCRATTPTRQPQGKGQQVHKYISATS